MPGKPPVRASRIILPFADRDFSWESFEEFFCSFLSAQPALTVKHAGQTVTGNVKSARPYGLRGASQKGIDLCATVEVASAAEEWAVQCKHYAKWTKKHTVDAIAACKYTAATHKFLLVTCEVGEDSREIIAEQGDWTLWDGREITQEFLSRLAPTDAAAILYRCFGPGWDTKFLNLPGTGPLLTPDAFFKPWRREAIYFHHNLPIVGRAGGLDELDAFVGQKRRVLLLTGRGGIGKSRLLSAWSDRFAKRHPGVLLRFVSRKSDDFERLLPLHGDRMVVVLDDAHQEGSLRQRLFEAAGRLENVQLILSLRPGPNEAIRQELYAAGYDSSEIGDVPPLGRLSDQDAYRLAELALGPKNAGYAPILYQASRDCPLIAVIGGALIQRGEATFNELSSHQDIRSAVFQKLEEQAWRAEAEGFQRQDIKEFLGLVSLLSPVVNDEAFRSGCAELLGGQWRQDRISALIQALENAGVLLQGSSGLRITPDLFSDDIAYRASYTAHGKATGFVKYVLAKFGDKVFETVARHLAEAEWRANEEHEKPDSIIAPIVDMFRTQFISGSFQERTALLDRWNQIAVLRPKETLEFVELALSATDSPKEEELPRFAITHSTLEFYRKQNSYGNLLTHLPPLLQAVGGHHEEYTEQALSLLWRLARERDDDENRNQNHPLTVMASVAGYANWKPLAISVAALNWIERFFKTNEWLNGKPKPLTVLQVLLKPFFTVWIDATFWMRRQLVLRAFPINVEAVRPMRERVLLLCEEILKRGDPVLTMGVCNLADEAAGPLHPPVGGATSDQVEASWLPERRKGLELFRAIVENTSHLAVHLTVRHQLLQYIRRGDSAEYIADCNKVLSLIPDTFDMRAMRALFSEAHDEFGEPYGRGGGDHRGVIELERKRWEGFLIAVSKEMLALYPNADLLADYLNEIAIQASEVAWESPHFRPLLDTILKMEPSIGPSITEYLLSHPDHHLISTFDLVVDRSTAEKPNNRLDAYRRALATENERLQSSAVYGFRLWRSEGLLPEEAWLLLESAATLSSSYIQSALVDFVEAGARNATPHDLGILKTLPFNFEHLGIVVRLLNALGDILEATLLPGAIATIREVLGKLVPLPKLEQNRMEYEISRLAKHAPAEVFWFLSERYAFSRSGQAPPDYVAFPYWAEQLPLAGLQESPEHTEMALTLGGRLITDENPDYALTTLLRIAIFAGSRNPEPLLENLLERVESPEKLERLLRLLTLTMSPLVMECPLWAKRCLLKAREYGDEVYNTVRRTFYINFSAGGRGYSNGEPDNRTRIQIEAIEKMARDFSADPELGPLFVEVAQSERRSIDLHREMYRLEMEE